MQKTIRRGDAPVFDRLYTELAPRVLAYLLRLSGGSRGDAEDLTQETFLAAFAARETFSGANPLAWLFGIARRRQRDAFRAASVRPQSTDDAPEIATADTLSETASRKIVLQNALDRLDEPERDAVLLVVVQGLTYAEAARVTGEPVGTVKWRVHAATKRLRGMLCTTFAEHATDARKETAPRAEPAI